MEVHACVVCVQINIHPSDRRRGERIAFTAWNLMYPLDVCPFLGQILNSLLETVYVAWLCGKIQKIYMAKPGVRISIFGCSCLGFVSVMFFFGGGWIEYSLGDSWCQLCTTCIQNRTLHVHFILQWVSNGRTTQPHKSVPLRSFNFA